MIEHNQVSLDVLGSVSEPIVEDDRDKFAESLCYQYETTLVSEIKH